MLERLDRYLTPLTITLAAEILVVKLRDQVIPFIRSEDPDGLGNIGNCVRTQIHANSMQKKC